MTKRNNRPTLNTPIFLLTRSILRGKHVWEAHRAGNPVLDAQGAAMVEAAERFDTRQAELEASEDELIRTRGLFEAAVQKLQQVKSACLSSLRLDLPDFDISGLIGSSVPEDVIADVRTIAARAEARVRDGETPSHLELIFASLAESLVETEEAASAAYEADTAAQRARDERYAAAVLVDDRMIAFRATVRAVLGSRHRDYRKLRSRALRELLEEGESTPDEPETSAPEAAGDDVTDEDAVESDVA